MNGNKMSKLVDTEDIAFLNYDYDPNLVSVDCCCKRRKIYVIHNLLSGKECNNIIEWMNSGITHEELGRDSRYD